LQEARISRASSLVHISHHVLALATYSVWGKASGKPVNGNVVRAYTSGYNSSLEAFAVRSVSGNPTVKESSMQQFMPLFLILVLCGCVFGYMTYRKNAERQARKKKRNQYKASHLCSTRRKITTSPLYRIST
jgi:hypothetical protein